MRTRFSVSRRLNLAFLIMIFLIIAAVAAGVWFSTSYKASIAAVRQGAQLSENVNDLRIQWFALVSSVDGLMLTRSTSYQASLKQDVQDFDGQLAALLAQPVGLHQQEILANKEILTKLSKINQELHTVLEEFNQFTTQGRFGSALTLRQTRLAALQNQLDVQLAQLSQNIQNESSIALEDAARIQFMILIYWLVIFIFAAATAIIVSLLVNRNIVHPIKHLIGDVNRITAGDLSPVQLLKQNDEIGDLSQAFSLMTDWLRESREHLEQRVAVRTQELERRTIQIQAAAEIARDVATNRRLDELLNNTVNLVRDRFGFYHAGIFLVDIHREFAVLQAATGQAGQEMLTNRHKLRIGETGLVGHVCDEGKPRIALDVGQDAVHFKNPHLPETRSEIALPLISGGQVIGALDVQSREPAAFDNDSILILQVMADQLATAIDSARLLQELQENYQELQTVYGNLVSQAWQKQNEAGEVIGYQYDGINLKPLISDPGQSPDDDQADAAGLHIPLQLRGLEIGSLDLFPGRDGLPEDEILLIKNLSARISQVLENARLFEDAQHRAERERLTGEITARMRTFNDPKAILETAVRELRNALQIDIHPSQDQSFSLTGGKASAEVRPENGNGSHQER